MSKIWFWITRIFYLLFVIFVLLSLWLSQEWVKGSVEFKKSGAINLVKILVRDYQVKTSQITGYAGEKKPNQKFLFFTSGNSYPDFGTINYFYGSSIKKRSEELKESAVDSKEIKKVVLVKDNSGIIWRTYENSPGCCKVKGATHIIDRNSAKLVFGQLKSKNPPKKRLPSDFQILSGLASTNKSGLNAVSKITKVKSSLRFLAAPGRYIHVPFLAIAPPKYVEIFAQAGTWLVTIALLILSFLFFNQKVDKKKKPLLDDPNQTSLKVGNPLESQV